MSKNKSVKINANSKEQCAHVNMTINLGDNMSVKQDSKSRCQECSREQGHLGVECSISEVSVSEAFVKSDGYSTGLSEY